MKNFLEDKRNIVIILLVILALIKMPQEGGRFVLWITSGVFCAAIFDLLINGLFLKKWFFPKSAIISGFILSGILDYRQPLLALIFLSLLGIASKYIIRFNGKHIFNPANFGLFLASVFRLPLTWTIEANIPLIIAFGIYFTHAFKKYFHVLGFLISFIILFGITKANPFGIISWFFLFVMLIEPKTSGYGALRGFIFGAIAGASSILAFKFMPGLDFFAASLFAANLSNPLLDRIRTK